MVKTNLPARAALTVVAALLTVSCVTEVHETPSARFSDTSIISVYDPDTAIPAGATFAWLPEAVHYYADERIKDAPLKSQIEQEIIAELKAKKMNFVDSANGARYTIAYTAALASSLDDGAIIQRYGLLPGNTRVPVNDANVEKGSLIIYVFNNKTDEIIWRSAAQAGVRFDIPAEERKQRIADVVTQLFQSFPVAE